MLIKTVSSFFRIICRFLEIKHSFKMWLNHNCVIGKRYLPEKLEKMRHCFEDSFNMNILNWKKTTKNNFTRTWSLRKAVFLRKITSFLSLRFEYKNYIFPMPSILLTFYVPEEYYFKTYKAPQSPLFYNIANLLQVFLRKSI